MFDCIYRDEVKQKIKERMRCLDDVRILNKGDAEALKQIEKCKQVLNQICCDIDDIRTADVQPVKHGYWEEVADYGGWGDTHYRCSVCGEEWYLEDGKPKDNNMNFCHRCGARMDGDE